MVFISDWYHVVFKHKLQEGPMPTQTTVKEWIIVSEALRNKVSCDQYDGENLIYSDSPAEEINNLIDADNSTFCVVCYVSPDDFFAIDVILHSAPLRVEGSAHIFAESEPQDLPFDNPRIAYIHFSPIDEKEFKYGTLSAMTSAKSRLLERISMRSTLSRLEDMRLDQDSLIRIGRSLQTEKDPDKLLRTILTLSKKITGADAGSIYLVEEKEDGDKQIRFKYSHTYSKDLPLEEFVIPFNTKSIAGYVAVTGIVLNIPDVYLLSEEDPVSFNASFDKSNNYRSKSMLVVPMRNHIDQIIGVIQLINSKEDPIFSGNEAFGIKLETVEDFEHRVVAFDRRYEHLMEAVAGQAAIAIENNRMISQILTQFEEFVKASVTAIESRDPATSGHSFRVAKICVEMLRAINESDSPPFNVLAFTETQIKELEYAALLHDFGKVYIDLAIFMKSKKLFPKDFENLQLKLDYLYRYVELKSITDEKRVIENEHQNNHKDLIGDIRKKRDEKLKRIRSIKEKITSLNEPSITDVDPGKSLHEIISEIEDLNCHDTNDNPMTVIGPLETTNLSIKKGSLNAMERHEIESHVMHTYSFVSNIPWPPEYKNIPEIALRHHEKLDGTGYPNGEKGGDILIQARIMAIADIYDALTATDRPYKKSIPHKRPSTF